ncbi:MAG: glycosyltransferase family 9 protein [Proteobacteria bacterium]|nr:glycosyltransferase family 9 protein [Pseudomonadota bacterium]
MTSILFLAPTDLGEAVLATGALAYATGERAVVTVVATPEAMPLFRSAPGVDASLAAGANVMGSAALWLRLGANTFDLAVDGRDGLLGRIAARRRIALQPGVVVQHRTEAWAQALGAERSLAPVLWLDDEARSAATRIAADARSLLVLAPGGVSPEKKWPAERFAAVARRLRDGPLSNASVIVLGAAARDAETARAIASSLDADGVAAVDLGRGIDLLAAAALMERATLCIGNDNALAHIAAAAGAPTLAIFGPTDERVRAPCGPRTRAIRGRSFAEASALDGGGAMEDVSIDAVEAAALELLHAGGLR